ncbi:unnamed protein product (mitochondrion) [Plasmodiophora brassicae]|uniref:non-specific serine/threonine protein kinase n=1 Tax=Plasmodiophora brassicae TaxID=37360 RepID=A0A3P3YDG8_PLABS|nr:unnamed protein product [Plasmodiophora brassicae]
MGNQLGVSGGSLQDLPSLLLELVSTLCFRRNLGGGKILKTVECLHAQGTVVVKNIADRCAASPCLLPFVSWHITPRAAFLVRPYIACSLYERLHMRPFLTDTEKAWMVYCILRALATLHGAGLCHSDLKTENILVNSFNWLVLADLSTFYKPIYIPDDNPYDFYTFFDAGRGLTQRRRCYLAPERFFSPSVRQRTQSTDVLQPSMDMFSCGCVIAEIFLEGEAIFDLTHLLLYKEDRFDPSATLAKISNVHVRDLIQKCIQLSPHSRPSAAECLTMFKDLMFPTCFDRLYSFMEETMHEDLALPDKKLLHLHSRFSSLVETITPNRRACSLSKVVSHENPHPPSPVKPLDVRPVPTTTDLSILLDQITSLRKRLAEESPDVIPQSTSSGGSGTADALLPLVSFVCACMRNVNTPACKLMALDMLESLSYGVSDAARLSRIVPFVMSMSVDPSALLRSEAVRILTKVLGFITVVGPSEKQIFIEYIFPSLSMLPQDSEEIVRISLAENLPRLADISKQFLDISTFTQPRGSPSDSVSMVPFQGSYTDDLEALQNIVCRLVGDTLTTTSSKVKIAILKDIAKLCVFFGAERCNSWLLPMLITVLNDRDWQLRAAFFHSVVGIAVFVGRVAFQNFLLPCIEQALFDAEETVIVYALQALVAAIELRLFEQHFLIDVTTRVTPLLCHPSTWIRIHSLRFYSAIADQLGPAKAYCLLGSRLRPFLRPEPEVYTLDRETLSQSLRCPLSRRAFSSRSPLNDQDDDEEHILAAMMPHLNGMNTVRQQRSHNALSAYAKSEADPLLKYTNMDDDIQLYAIAVEHTVPESCRQAIVVDAAVPESLGTVQLLEHIAGDNSGVHSADFYLDVSVPDGNSNALQFKPYPGCGYRHDQLPSLREMFFRRMATKSAGTSGSKSVVRQAASFAPPAVCTALEVPSPPPDLGEPHAASLSTSWTFGNHGPPFDTRVVAHPHTWRPQGILVADLIEHRSSISQISVSRDNQLMVAGSVDGCVRVWDCSRLEKSISSSSHLIYNMPDGGVNCVCVCDASHSVAVGSSSGSVQVLRVEFTAKKDGSVDRFVGVTVLAKLEPREGGVVSVQHCNRISESLVVFASELGRVQGWDLRSRRPAFSMEVADHHGLLTHMRIGPSLHSILTGSARGFVTIFDARFHKPVQSWRHSSHAPISCLQPFPTTTVVSPGSPLHHPDVGPVAFIGTHADDSVTAFDLFTGDARASFHMNSAGPVPHLEADIASYGSISEELRLWPMGQRNRGISGALLCPGSWAITSSWSRQIMFWDLAEPRASYLISGQHSVQPSFVSYSGRMQNDVAVFEDSIESLSSGPAPEQPALKPRRRVSPKDAGHLQSGWSDQSLDMSTPICGTGATEHTSMEGMRT